MWSLRTKRYNFSEQQNAPTQRHQLNHHFAAHLRAEWLAVVARECVTRRAYIYVAAGDGGKVRSGACAETVTPPGTPQILNHKSAYFLYMEGPTVGGAGPVTPVCGTAMGGPTKGAPSPESL